MKDIFHRTNRFVIGGLVVLLLAAGGYAGYYFINRTAQTNPPGKVQPQSQAAPTQNKTGGTTRPPAFSYPIKVYFSRHPDSDDDPSRVFPVNRVSPTAGVGSFAVQQLLAGPTNSERSDGYFTQVRIRSGTSDCGGPDFNLKISQGVATLRFCREFDLVGIISDAQAESEMTATLKQFPTVKKVVILNNKGDCLFNLSGQNLCM